MVTVEYTQSFRELVIKIKDNARKEKSSILGMQELFANKRIQIKKQIAKLVRNPEVGKPMRYARKHTRELYIPPFRLSYAYLKEEDKIVLLDLYHKDEQ